MKKIDWFEMWFDDKRSILETMIRNLTSDLEAGYDPHGMCIGRQQCLIGMYKNQFDQEVDMLKNMTEVQANHWCRLDLKKRGAID